MNSVFGHYASLFCFLPYYPWKYIHTEHHSWAGIVDRDPTLKLVRDYKSSQRLRNFGVRLAWKTFLPFLAFAQHCVFWTYPVVLFREGRLKKKRLPLSILSILLLGGVYSCLFFFHGKLFNLVNFGPAFVIYLVLTELVNFPHHLGTQLYQVSENSRKLPLWEQWKVTRSCYYPKGVAEFLLLNFNFHTEHHFFPDLPWHELRKVRPAIRAVLGSNYQESVGISWNLENRRKNPEEVFLKDGRGNARHRQLMPEMPAEKRKA